MSSGSCSSLIILSLDQQFLYIHVLISTQLKKQGESSAFSGVPSVWLSLLRFPDSEILAALASRNSTLCVLKLLGSAGLLFPLV